MVKPCDRLHNLRTCADWEADRKRRYVDETRQHILPLVEPLDRRIYDALQVELTRIQRDLLAVPAPT